jgi:hypothetical protein
MFSVAVVGGFVWNSRADSNPADTSHTYQSDHFTIQLPQNISPVYDIEYDDRMTSLAIADAEQSVSFHVFGRPFNEPLTTDDIANYYPFDIIDTIGLATVGGEPAFAFDHNNNDLDGTYEVWFVHSGRLYKVLTRGGLSSWVMNILQTWQFK